MDLTVLWAKTGEGNQYHPLLHHLLDVGVVARAMWAAALPGSLRVSFCRALGASTIDEAASIIAYLASLHDVGKAAPGFQAKSLRLAANLPCELAIPPGIDTTIKHGVVSAREMPAIASNSGVPLVIDEKSARILGRIIGGHHGIFPQSDEVADGRRAYGDETWRPVRLQLTAGLAILLGVPEIKVSDLTDPALVPLLAGFVTVADWIGSSAEFPHAGPVAIDAYLPRAKGQAQAALEHFGWLPAMHPSQPATFADIFFPFLPNALQQAVSDIIDGQSAPYLLIVEAPMGMGKTEAALYAVDYNLTHGISGGMFIGLPTQATTNAMYQRVHDDYLVKRGHSGVLNLQLIHGHAGMVLGEDHFIDTPVEDGDSVEMRLAARQWFQGRKRPLLAPFGIGTVDQALLAVLQTRHWFVRLFGLAGKTVVIDEVHAYDTYMSTILDRLLAWLAALDCSVILLSATLPPGRRRELARAYGGIEVESNQAQYPRLTLAARQPDAPAQITVTEIARDEITSRDIALKILPTDLRILANRLKHNLADGGCAAIICNTVDRAQEAYRALTEDGARLSDTDYLLFHARMPYGMREKREEQVLARFGKGLAGNQERYARRAILVATQVVEQSLDLDFDWMASEMAPADLLLQRLGRLHRHQKNDPNRPPALWAPTLHLLCDADPAGPPPETFGASEHIYARYVLLRSWLALRGVAAVRIPEDIDGLIGQVYELERQAPDAAWQHALADAWADLSTDMTKAQRKANSVLVKSPCSPLLLLRAFNADLVDDEDPSKHQDIRAATRDGRPSVTVICLLNEGGAWRPWGSDIRISADRIPDHETTRILLRAAIPISHRAIYQALLDVACPVGWHGNAHLRHTRVVIFDNGAAEVGNYRLVLDEALGLSIIRKEEIDDVELQFD